MRLAAENKQSLLVVLTSTVLPGASTGVVIPLLEKSSGKRAGKDFGFCYNPEFIALGSVIHDLLHPDFILIGENDERAGRVLEEWYRGYLDNKPAYSHMSPPNAELTKIAVNTFVTTKIAFANALATMCSALPGADVDVVCAALGLDSRIGRRYLKGALSYGGPCFPRDNRAFAHVAAQLGVTATLAEATDLSNRALVTNHVAWVRAHLRPRAAVAVLGTAYKPDTPVVEESAALALAKQLVDAGHPVLVYDPLALDGARAVLGEAVRYAGSVAECLASADAVVVANPCSEWKSLGPEDFPRRSPPFAVLDCWRLLRDRLETCPWITYRALGLGPV